MLFLVNVSIKNEKKYYELCLEMRLIEQNHMWEKLYGICEIRDERWLSLRKFPLL